MHKYSNASFLFRLMAAFNFDFDTHLFSVSGHQMVAAKLKIIRQKRESNAVNVQ